MDDDYEAPPPVEVPPSELSAAALRGVIEAFVLREGTDYGTRDWSFEDKVAQVRAQLDAGTAKIMFEPVSNSVTLVLGSERGAPARPPADV